jgi:hypothetical protein
METPVKQSVGKTYAQLIRFGRLLENYKTANDLSRRHPGLILQFVDAVDHQLLWTSTDEFFSVFTPIKRYADDGMWDYKSTMEMRKERLGTHFGKDDFKQILMTKCHENRYLHLVGISFMWSISRIHMMKTGGNLALDFMDTL